MLQLTWLGDEDAKRAARRVPYRLLETVEQVGDPASGN
jgi:adenine-specific DNA-methyltransferase